MKVLNEEEKAESNKICWDVKVPEGWKDIKVAKFD